MASTETTTDGDASEAANEGERDAWRGCADRAEDFSAVLLDARRRGMTYRETAEVSGLAVGTIHRICKGGVTGDPATQDRIAELDVV
jgi:DNA-directed RNA polymerase specialized sigma24 family protein